MPRNGTNQTNRRPLSALKTITSKCLCRKSVHGIIIYHRRVEWNPWLKCYSWFSIVSFCSRAKCNIFFYRGKTTTRTVEFHNSTTVWTTRIPSTRTRRRINTRCIRDATVSSSPKGHGHPDQRQRQSGGRVRRGVHVTRGDHIERRGDVLAGGQRRGTRGHRPVHHTVHRHCPAAGGVFPAKAVPLVGAQARDDRQGRHIRVASGTGAQGRSDPTALRQDRRLAEPVGRPAAGGQVAGPEHHGSEPHAGANAVPFAGTDRTTATATVATSARRHGVTAAGNVLAATAAATTTAATTAAATAETWPGGRWTDARSVVARAVGLFGKDHQQYRNGRWEEVTRSGTRKRTR